TGAIAARSLKANGAKLGLQNSCPAARQAANRAIMVSMDRVRAYAQQIGRTFSPDRIVLFGSYAYGSPTEDSDVDLLIIMQFDPTRERKSLDIRRAIPAGFPVDLIVRTPEMVRAQIAGGDLFLPEILQRGTVLYEACN